MKLNNWSVEVTNYDMYKPNNQLDIRLCGNVSGHERYADGEKIYTSRIVGRLGDKIIVSSGCIFQLGDISKKFQQKFPDALSRLHDSIKFRAVMF